MGHVVTEKIKLKSDNSRLREKEAKDDQGREEKEEGSRKLIVPALEPV